jgi:hypothetical protein
MGASIASATATVATMSSVADDGAAQRPIAKRAAGVANHCLEFLQCTLLLAFGLAEARSEGV